MISKLLSPPEQYDRGVWMIDEYQLIKNLASSLYSSNLEHREFFRSIKEGDLVFETSTRSRPDVYGTTLGFLDRVCFEKIQVDDWPEDEELPEEKVYYIKSLKTGEIVRWVNAEFLKVPLFPLYMEVSQD